MSGLAWHDYLVFGLLTLVYTFIGTYYSYTAQIKRAYRFLLKKNKITEDAEITTEEIFLGGRKLTLLPIVGTTAATFLSAITILANNAEVYGNGIEFIYIGLSYFIVYPIAAEIYTPVFYNLHISSSNEYLEMRFSKIVRILVTIIFLIQMILYSGIALFAPGLALNFVIGTNIIVPIVVTGGVATFYTALGGLRAVIWTDLIQVFVILSSLIMIIILGTINVGGFKNLWEISLSGGRLNINNFNPNPFIRQSFWSLVIGGTGLMLIATSTNQLQIQRYLSCKDLQTAKRSIYINLPIGIIFLIIQAIGGLIAYVKYSKCDPIKGQNITKQDQMLPFLVMDLFKDIPLIRGIFLSCIFAASLSTLSSTINCISFVIVEDLMIEIFMMCRKNITIKQSTLVIIARALGFFIGVGIIILAFLLSLSNATLFYIIFNLFGSLGGPVFTVFTLGIFFPFINKWGALLGLLTSLMAGLWISIGFILKGTPTQSALPVGDCTTTTRTTSASASPISTAINVYNLSYFYYSTLCFIVGTIVASIVSLLTGMNTKHPISQSLIAWQATKVYAYLPNWMKPQTASIVVKSVDIIFRQYLIFIFRNSINH